MKREINVCHIISADLWGGAEAQVYYLVRELNKYDQIKLSVITLNEGILVDRLNSCSINNEVINESANNPLSIIWHIYKILKITNAEIIHVHGFKEACLGGIAARLRGKRVQIFRTFHGKGLTNGAFRHRLIERVNGYFFSDQLIAVSEDLREFLLGCGFRQSMFTVLHNGVNLADVSPVKASRTVKHSLGIPDDAFVIGTLGRMVKIKGHKFFLEGAREVVAQNPGVYFVLSGDGPLMKDAMSWVNNHNMKRNIKITGFRNDPYDVLNSFDVFALTSLHEGVPMVLLEAMCLGKPIIATEVGGMPEIISDRVTGLMIPPGNPKRFASACMELMTDDVLKDKLADNCRNIVMERYSAIQVAAKVYYLYAGGQ